MSDFRILRQSLRSQSSKSQFLDLKWTLIWPKMKISKIRKPTFFCIPLKAYHERFQNFTPITAITKLKKSIFGPKMDPNLAKNENFKNPKTYVFLYTPKGIS